MGETVLVLADYGGAYSGNFVSSLRALAAASARVGLDVGLGFSELAAGRPWLDELRRDGLRVDLLPKYAPTLERVRRVRALVARDRPAIVHTHFTTYDVPAALAAASSRTDRRPRALWHVHSPPDPERSAAAAVKETVKLRWLGRSVGLVAVSSHLLRALEARGAPRGRGVVVENGVDLARLAAAAPREETRRGLGIAPEARVALLLGWDPHRKGVDLALAAARRLGGGVTWLVVGGEQLARYVAARGGGGPWLVLAGARERVADFYAAADLFVSPSRAEGFPYAMCEAMAAGLPLVVSRVAGQEWALAVPGVRGFPSGDAAALARAVAETVGTSAVEAARAQAALRAYARTNLSLERWAARVVDVYRRELGAASEASPRSCPAGA
jgi:glycosyltransferase involved in cell wall biosynthesis